MKYKCIDEWIKTGGFLKAIIEKSGEKHIPIINFLYQREALGELLGPNKVAQRANEIVENFDSKKDDIRAYYLFLTIWGGYACTYRRFEEAIAIYNLLVAITSKEIPKEFISNRIRLNGLIQSMAFGDKDTREKCIKESIEILPKNSKLKYLSLSEYYTFLAQTYRYVEIQDQVEGYLSQTNLPAHVLNSYIAAKLMHLHTTYQFEKANELYQLIQIGSVDKMIAFAYTKMKKFEKAVKNKFLLDEPVSEYSLDTSYDYSVIISVTTHFLACRNARESLKWARKGARDFGNPIHSIGFTSYSLIRAELSNENERGARIQLLEKNKKNGLIHLDNFFWARVELLAGNFELASDYFRRVVEACEFYDAMAVLENEILLAVELRAVDLFKFYQELKIDKIKKPLPLKKRIVKSTSGKVGAHRLIGESQASKNLKTEIKKYASLKSSVLIIGETGVGKDVVARALHEESDRAKEPFLAINCGAINESLLQSELFGHVAGAYTGAEKAHKGIFEAAGDGTVFLDEIGEISPGLQVALLRVLEAKEIRPVGSSKAKPFHARILAATNAPLEKLVDEGMFRMDLLYRLKKLIIRIEPLRERPNDILALTQYFFQSQNLDEETPTLSVRLLNAFKEFNWPGNVRELKNEVERMRLLHSEKLEYDLEDSLLLSEQKSALKKETIDFDVYDKDQELQNIRSENKVSKRLEEIKHFFEKHQKLTRNEISKVMKVSLATATTDLKKLLKADFIEKIEPSPSPRSHYFVLKQH